MSSATLSHPVYPHIELDSAGFPKLSGTTLKVVELVMAQEAHGWSPQELHFQFPHLSLGQIHAALAYYWDHKEELDRDIERRARRVETLEREIIAPPVAVRLRSLKPGA